MWLYTNKGFLSIVENSKDKDQLLVRGRFNGDIETHFPNAKVEVDAGTDYKYRTYLPREEVTARLVDYVDLELTYSNFKNSVPLSAKDRDNFPNSANWDRHIAYGDVWAIMKDVQDRQTMIDMEASGR